MQRADLRIERLQRRQAVESGQHGARIQRTQPTGLWHLLGHQVERGQAVDAADAAASAAHQRAAALLQAGEAAAGDLQVHLDGGRLGVAALGRRHGTGRQPGLDAEALGRRIEDALAQGEAEREGVQVLRRAHHHRVGDAVEDQCHRHFVGDPVAVFRGLDGAGLQPLALHPCRQQRGGQGDGIGG